MTGAAAGAGAGDEQARGQPVAQPVAALLHTAATGLAPAVSVLPFYNASLARYSMHKQTTRAKCFHPRGDSFFKEPQCVCDCTHFCYTPLMYDDAFFTPLHALLLAGLSRRRG